MNLYFLRHGIAVEPSEWKRADSERPLTKDGIRKMKKVAKGMRKVGVAFDWILTSPYRRAHDTAQIVAKEFRASKKLRITRSLATDGDSKGLVRHLARDFRSWETVLLVGHEPYLSQLIAVLIGGNPAISLDLKKGGLCKLAADSLTYDRSATLEWWLPPKILKNLK
jgi:phosphohistidine phosphatase